MDAFLQMLLQSLPMIAGPLAVYFATWAVKTIRPALTGKQIMLMVVPVCSFLAAIVAWALNIPLNPVVQVALNFAATAIYEFLKEWNKPIPTPPTP